MAKVEIKNTMHLHDVLETELFFIFDIVNVMASVF